MEQEALSTDSRSRKVEVPRLHEGDPRQSHVRGAQVQRDQPDLRASACASRINNYESSDQQCRKARRCAARKTRSCRGSSDLHALLASTTGKIEMEYVGEEKKEDELVEKLINRCHRQGLRPALQPQLVAESDRVFQLRLGRRGLGPDGRAGLSRRHQGDSRAQGSDQNPRHPGVAGADGRRRRSSSSRDCISIRSSIRK